MHEIECRVSLSLRLPPPTLFAFFHTVGLGDSAQALERQKEYTDAIRIERDELREEVVKLKDILKVLRQCVDAYFILLPGNKYESFVVLQVYFKPTFL